MGNTGTTPKPQPITATEATLINRHNEYPALFNVVLDYNQDGSGLTWPTTLLIMGLTVAIVLTVVATYKKLRRCHQKRKIKEQQELREIVNVKTIRPKSVVYDNVYEEVMIQPAAGRQPAPALPLIEHQPAPALPVIDRQPNQAEPEAAVVFLDEPLAEAIIENPTPQAANHAGARRHRR